MKSCRQIVTSVSFFRFLANLGQTRKPDSSRILAVQSVKLIFSLTVTFYQKNAEIRKIIRVLVLKGTCSENPKKHLHSSKWTPKKPTQIKLNRLFRKLLILLFLFDVLLFPFPVLLYLQTNNICILKLLNVFQAFFSILLLQSRITPKCKNIFIQQYFLKNIHPFH